MRLDSRFHIENLPLRGILAGRWPLATVRDVFGQKNILLPNIFERIPAQTQEFGKPILVPYDCFRYMPYSKDLLSRTQVSSFSNLEIKSGWLLMVCSGRNLGPVTLVDSYLEQFVLSHDMLRICSKLSDDLLYFMALMHTKIGQALVRRDRNGSVIDHLDAKQLGALRYPLVGESLRALCVDSFRQAFKLRERARSTLRTLKQKFLDTVGLFDFESQLKDRDLARRFERSRSSIKDRFDCEPFAPRYERYRKMIRDTGSGRPLYSLASVMRPPGRYKTLYVEGEDFGLKLMSGRNLAQYRPIGLKVMSKEAWSDPEAYIIRQDMVLLTADGRAEENLADCALVRADRDGWAASGHIHRLVPKAGVHPGLLYLACSCGPVQMLLKALATGSVVDALSGTDVSGIIVPYPLGGSGNKLGDEAVRAWDSFSEAIELEDAAINKLTTELDRAS
jgi:type I restriction enzyme, S subunit